MAPKTGEINPMSANNIIMKIVLKIIIGSILLLLKSEEIIQAIIIKIINKFSIAERNIIGLYFTSVSNGLNMVLQNANGEFIRIEVALHSISGREIIVALCKVPKSIKFFCL